MPPLFWEKIEDRLEDIDSRLADLERALEPIWEALKDVGLVTTIAEKVTDEWPKPELRVVEEDEWENES